MMFRREVLAVGVSLKVTTSSGGPRMRLELIGHPYGE